MTTEIFKFVVVDADDRPSMFLLQIQGERVALFSHGIYVGNLTPEDRVRLARALVPGFLLVPAPTETCPECKAVGVLDETGGYRTSVFQREALESCTCRGTGRRPIK